MPDNISRDAIIAAARNWIDTPWRHQGRDGDRGIDCVGLIVCVAADIGIPIDDLRNYRRVATSRQMEAEFDRRMIRRKIAAHAPGAVLLFKYRPFPRHVAIGTMRDGQPWIVHSRQDAGRGRVIEEPYSETWKSRLAVAYDYPGAEPWPA